MRCLLNRDFIENFIRYHKKTIIKVVAGFVLFVTAFLVFCIRDYRYDNDEFTLLNEEVQAVNKQNDIVQTVTSNSIGLDENNKTEKIYIDISGAVENPYVYEMNEGSRVYEAIELAGGLKEDADISNINLAQILKDEDKIIIYTEEQLTNEIMSHANEQVPSVLSAEGAYKSESQTNSAELININSATSAQLQSITGIGPSTAEKIISYREEHGQFIKIEDIMNVSGIGEKTFEKLKVKITV